MGARETAVTPVRTEGPAASAASNTLVLTLSPHTLTITKHGLGRVEVAETTCAGPSPSVKAHATWTTSSTSSSQWPQSNSTEPTPSSQWRC